MPSRHVLLILLGVFATAAASSPVPAQSRVERVTWMQRHLSAVRSLEFSDTDYSDLAPVARAIGKRRVVLLGEQGHGDGETFRAKSRLVRYLHEKHGFDVIVFESGFYECGRTWQDAQSGMSLADSARNCMFELWSNSRQVRPLLEYMDTRKNGRHPLALAGMDFQPSGERARFLTEDLGRFIVAQPDTTGLDGPHRSLTAGYALIMEPARARTLSPTQRDSVLVALQSAASSITERPLRDVSSLGVLGRADFWRRTLAGVTEYVGFIRAMSKATPGNLPSADVMNRRDAIMGENLAWLASQKPQRKIVVWGATSHFIRERTGIEGDPAPNMVPAGHVAAARLKGQVYTIGFIGTEGEQGTSRRGSAPPSAISLPDSLSLDGLFRATTLDHAFLDLRKVARGGAWLGEPLVARPLGYSPMRTKWPRHLDGIFFIRRMTPSTPVISDPSR